MKESWGGTLAQRLRKCRIGMRRSVAETVVTKRAYHPRSALGRGGKRPAVGGRSDAGFLAELAGKEEDVLETECLGDLADGEAGFREEVAGAAEAGVDNEVARALSVDALEDAGEVINAVAGAAGQCGDGVRGGRLLADLGGEAAHEGGVVRVEAGGGGGEAGQGFAHELGEQGVEEALGGGLGGGLGLGAEGEDAAHERVGKVGVGGSKEFDGRGEAAGGGDGEVEEVDAEGRGAVVGGFVAAAGAHPEAHAGGEGNFTVGGAQVAAAGPDEPEVVVAQARRPVGAEMPVGLAAHARAMGQEQGGESGWKGRHESG